MIVQLTSLPFRLVAQAQANCPGGGTCDTGLPTTGATAANLQAMLQVAFGILGAVAVLMIVIGGLQFMTAQGDPASVVKARKVIVYALVGLVIAISAEAIVTFVVGKF